MIARPSLVAAPAVHRDGWPSIYDDPPTALADLDWSTPLFVQAARQAHFDEVAAYHHLPSSAWKKTAQAGSLLLYERRAV